jgi:hypothetical protein
MLCLYTKIYIYLLIFFSFFLYLFIYLKSLRLMFSSLHITSLEFFIINELQCPLKSIFEVSQIKSFFFFTFLVYFSCDLLQQRSNMHCAQKLNFLQQETFFSLNTSHSLVCESHCTCLCISMSKFIMLNACRSSDFFFLIEHAFK